MSDDQSALAALVAGANPKGSLGEALTSVALVDLAHWHGVVSLADSRLRTLRQVQSASLIEVPEEIHQAFKTAALKAAMESLMLEAETRRLVTAMEQAGVPGLLLKGQAIAQWAYADPTLRTSGDIDVLVASDETAQVLVKHLCEAGYELFQPSGDLVAMEMMLRRQVVDGVWVEIDLHTRVVNSPLFSERFTFDELMADSLALPALGANARGLGPAHAFIHASMHRAATLAVGVDDRLKWLYDIPAFAHCFTATDWQRTQHLAIERGLAGVCLSMIEAAQTTFGADFVAVPDDLTAALRHAAKRERLDPTRLSDWRYMLYQSFLSLPTARMRLRWIWQKLWPSRDYMAYLYGRADLGYWGLIAIRAQTAVRRLLRLKV